MHPEMRGYNVCGQARARLPEQEGVVLHSDRGREVPSLNRIRAERTRATVYTMHTRSIAEQWQDWPLPSSDVASDVHDDGASYIDAATVALTFDSVRLGASLEQAVTGGEDVTPAALRVAMGCMATGVCVVTSVWEGDDVAMTANSVTSVSLDPPLLLVCIDRRARFHDAIAAAGQWGVSILDATAYDISSACAKPDRLRSGQLRTIGHRRGITGVALLDSSVATLECKTEEIYPGGDHSIVVGRVEALSTRGSGSHPLLFHQGGYRWL